MENLFSGQNVFTASPEFSVGLISASKKIFDKSEVPSKTSSGEVKCFLLIELVEEYLAIVAVDEDFNLEKDRTMVIRVNDFQNLQVSSSNKSQLEITTTLGQVIRLSAYRSDERLLIFEQIDRLARCSTNY